MGTRVVGSLEDDELIVGNTVRSNRAIRSDKLLKAVARKQLYRSYSQSETTSKRALTVSAACADGSVLENV